MSPSRSHSSSGSTRRLVEMEPFAVPGQVMCSDAPGVPALVRRERGVGHDDVLTVGTLHTLHARILEAVDTRGTRATEHVPELVGTAVARRQDQYVRDVVEEP